MKVLYFGCYDDKGHYARAGSGVMRYSQEERDFAEQNPWRTAIDGGLCPTGLRAEGVALIHHKDGWTALSFWDRSIDQRHGSNSNFFAEGTFDFEEMVAIAQATFPSVLARFKFPIVEGKIGAYREH